MPSPKSSLIPIAADHAGVDLKDSVQRLLSNYRWEDLGPKNHDRVDYPDFAEAVATRVSEGKASRGVLICGSGIGMCMAANKIDGVRAALVDNPVAARLSREHNDANVLCLGARFLAPEYAAEIIRTWLETEFSEDPRHVARVEKIMALQKRSSAGKAAVEAPAVSFSATPAAPASAAQTQSKEADRAEVSAERSQAPAAPSQPKAAAPKITFTSSGARVEASASPQARKEEPAPVPAERREEPKAAEPRTAQAEAPAVPKAPEKPQPPKGGGASISIKRK